MWQMQCDLYILTNSLIQLQSQYNKCNVTNAVWVMQCDKCDVANAMGQMQCDKYNVTHTIW